MNTAQEWRMAKRAILSLLTLTILASLSSHAALADEACPRALAQAVPERSADASTGAEFVRAVARLTEAERETAIAAELLGGNLPPFLRQLRPVTLGGPRDGRDVRVTLCVMPDYLALGSDDDFLRLPMGLSTALTVADRFGFVLPTRAMVDAIYDHADVRLRPQPLPPTEEMRSTVYYWRHQTRIGEQLRTLGVRPGVLLAGQKKDLVLTNRLLAKPGRVAIYGWHQGQGRPIQPLSTVHGARYADYSHGVRLVSAVAYVNGQPRALLDLLEDRRLAGLISDEGPISGRVILAAANGGPSVLQQRKPRW
jgi:hypothetical protein